MLKFCLKFHISNERPCIFQESTLENPRWNCSLGTLKKYCKAYEDYKWNGMTYLRRKTGCTLPCHRFNFKIKEIASNHPKVLFPDFNSSDPVAEIFFNDREYIKKIEQVERYDFKNAFIGDVGGALGLFIGLSFWTICQAIPDFVIFVSKHLLMEKKHKLKKHHAKSNAKP